MNISDYANIGNQKDPFFLEDIKGIRTTNKKNKSFVIFILFLTEKRNR